VKTFLYIHKRLELGSTILVIQLPVSSDIAGYDMSLHVKLLNSWIRVFVT